MVHLRIGILILRVGPEIPQCFRTVQKFRISGFSGIGGTIGTMLRGGTDNFLEYSHQAVERTSAHVVRLAAKVLLGKEDLPKSATALQFFVTFREVGLSYS